MAVVLSRSYGGFASGAIVEFPEDTEAALIAQGWAVAAPGFIHPADDLHC